MLFGQTFCSPPYPLQQAKINQKRQSPHIRWLLEYQNLGNLASSIPPFIFNLTKLSNVMANMLHKSLNLGIANLCLFSIF